MTLPASPPITMAQVRAEFGGTAGTTKLSAYVRGGAYVPNTTKNASVPTAVPITLSQLCGASAFSASVSPSSVNGSRTGSGTVTSGTTTCTATGATSPTYSWTRVSGDTTTSATASTSATTAFSATVVAGNTKNSVWKCTVHDSSGATVDSNTVSVSLTAN